MYARLPVRPSTYAVAAALWLVLVVVADLLLPHDIVPTALLCIAPLIASARLGVRGTAGFSAAALVLTVWSGFWNDAWSDPQHWVRTFLVALVALAAVSIARVRVERDERFARISVIAEVTQRAILPRLPSESGRMRIASRYLSAYEDTLVGGDLYDFTVHDDAARFVVGDVRGKGVAAIEHAARVIRAFRQFATVDAGLAEAAADISAYVAQFFDDEDFATALLVEIGECGRLRIVNCGHPTPVLVTRDGRVTLVETEVDLPLGLGEEYAAVEVDWQPGDRLLLYTDGLSEARCPKGAFLRLLEAAATLADGDPDAALDRLLEDVRRHVPGGRLQDDLAVVLIEHAATPSPTTTRPSTGFALPLLEVRS